MYLFPLIVSTVEPHQYFRFRSNPSSLTIINSNCVKQHLPPGNKTDRTNLRQEKQKLAKYDYFLQGMGKVARVSWVKTPREFDDHWMNLPCEKASGINKQLSRHNAVVAVTRHIVVGPTADVCPMILSNVVRFVSIPRKFSPFPFTYGTATVQSRFLPNSTKI